MTVDNPEQQRRLPALEKLVAQKIQRAETIVGLRRTTGLQAAAADIRSVLALLIAVGSVVTVHRDLGKRERAEEALRASEDMYRMVLSGVGDYAIVMLDPKGTILSWNVGAEPPPQH